MKPYTKIHPILFYLLATLSFYACTSSNLKNTPMENLGNLEPYKDDDVVLSVSVARHNISNPQQNYSVILLGDGKIVRKGGIYEKTYPSTVSKEVLDTIISKGKAINPYDTMPMKKPYHDGPTCNLTVYGQSRSLDFCNLNNQAVTDLLNYVDSVVVLPMN